MDKDQIMEIVRKRESKLDEWLQNSEKSSISKLKKARKESLTVKLKRKKKSGGSS